MSALGRLVFGRALPRLRNEIGAFLVDLGNRVLGAPRGEWPPTRLHFVGTGDFKAIGFEFLRYFVELGGLRPDEDVLDIGCGIGRMALPLTGYLKRGRYQGIDIVPQGIDWCRTHITPRHPHFQFALADVHNARYHPKGTVKAAEYRFPFADAAFDFVFLTSVFTHLLPRAAERYMMKVGRMLRPGGRVLSAWFLLQEDARRLLDERRSALPFERRLDDRDDVLVASPDLPEAAIAFDAALVRRMHERAGLGVDSISLGSWCGRGEYLSFQDILVARKSAEGHGPTTPRP